ncbi:hypothetical protein AABB24_013117, partial [Solanum stoloniferum]
STLSAASNVSSRGVFTASKRRHCTDSTHTGSTLPLAVVFCSSLSICSPSITHLSSLGGGMMPRCATRTMNLIPNVHLPFPLLEWGEFLKKGCWSELGIFFDFQIGMGLILRGILSVSRSKEEPYFSLV